MQTNAAEELKSKQSNIILKNTQNTSGNSATKRGTYISKRQIFRIYNSLSFINKSYTSGGFISCFLCLLSLGILIYILAVSVSLRGKVSGNIGFNSLYSLIISLFGLIIGLRSFKEEDKNYLFSKIGSYCSLFIIVFWIIIYLRGLFMK